MNKARTSQIRLGWVRVLIMLVLLLGFSAEPAAAQQVRTLEVREGEVYIDGTRVPANQLPASFEPGGIELQYTFAGDAEPAFELNGYLYRLENGQLVEEARLPEDASRPTFQFNLAAPAQIAGATAQAYAAQYATAPPPAVPASVFVVSSQELLEQQAREFEQLSRELRAFRVPEAAVAPRFEVQESARSLQSVFRQQGASLRELEDASFAVEVEPLADRLMRQAQRAMLAARQLPVIEVRSYLNDIQQHDRELYSRLVREQQLEHETLELAGRIRRMPAGSARTERETVLRAQLEQIFALKEENRRREIEQLKEQLGSLQQRLDERQRLHDRIIENRMQELIGEGDETNW